MAFAAEADASAVPPSVVSAAEDTLAAAESVGDHISQLLAAAAEDPDAVAELLPLLRARAFLAVAQAATSLLGVRLRCSGVDPDEHPIRKEFERLSLYQEKLNRFEDWDKAPFRPTTTLNTQAAARFIGHSLSHLTSDQKRSMQAISRGERRGWSGQKRKTEPLPEKKSVRAAAEEFLAKAAQELIGHTDSRVKEKKGCLSGDMPDSLAMRNKVEVQMMKINLPTLLCCCTCGREQSRGIFLSFRSNSKSHRLQGPDSCSIRSMKEARKIKSC